MIVQAANTGLTGGSTPAGEYDRPLVLISTEHLEGIIPIRSGEEAICIAGSTLTQLEDSISTYSRAPHSVIGSTCIGASVVGGICNNSGGALVKRGPAFTEKALFGQVDADGNLKLVNHLGVNLGTEPEQMLRNLEQRSFDIETVGEAVNPTVDYSQHIRQTNEATPARYNADVRGLFEASGSAGKVIVFAVRLPTFCAPVEKQTFIVSTDDPELLSNLRKKLLEPTTPLPETCEYLHRNAIQLAVAYGNDVCVLLRLFGATRMPRILAFQKHSVGILGQYVTNMLAQLLGKIAPHPLPPTLRATFVKYEHHLILTAADDAIEPIEKVLANSKAEGGLNVEEAAPKDAEAAMRVRFAVAGAMVRYRNVVRGSGELAALDFALPRNADAFFLKLPESLANSVLERADYGHFLCNVFHCDLVLGSEVASEKFEEQVKDVVEAVGGSLPAEHNFGHMYQAPMHVVAFYKSLDPTNSLNPGIGKTSRQKHWR
jgi:D-lactate dehydrogenase